MPNIILRSKYKTWIFINPAYVKHFELKPCVEQGVEGCGTIQAFRAVAIL
jgi:hypothetical protein